MAAVKAGESAAALSLLQRKADPNAAEADGTTALHWAVRNDDATLVDRLLRAGAKADGREPLRRHADRAGVRAAASAPIVERLLKAGVSANLTGPLGETALHTCARAGHVAAAQGAADARRVASTRSRAGAARRRSCGRRRKATPRR